MKARLLGAKTIVRLGKWIKDTKPEQPLTEVAGRALANRLSAVWHYAPLAATKSDADIEYVHQLRVATRRARAALRIFADLLPKRQARWMKKKLRHLRKAAGDARDLDVLGERLRKIAKQKEFSHLRAVVEQVAARRQKAQKPLRAAYQEAKREGFDKRLRELAKSVRWQGEGREPTFAEAARMTLAPLVDDFFTAASADLSDVKALHQMRIAGKQVRYAMELLAGAFDDTFRGELYETFEEVQEKVGTINDHATAIATFNQWLERADYNGGREELAELIASEEKQLDCEHQEFHKWWTADRVSELKQQFASVLKTPAFRQADETSPGQSCNTLHSGREACP